MDPLALRRAFATFALCLGLGVVVGGIINLVNGGVSPRYFRVIMGWREWSDAQVLRAAVVQGIFEGLIYGVFFGIVVLINVSAATSLLLALRQTLRYLLLATATVLACWVAGGLIAMALATASPDWYAATFRGVPADTAGRLAYAWVGGSIWGALAGGFLGVTVAVLLMWANRGSLTRR